MAPRTSIAALAPTEAGEAAATERPLIAIAPDDLHFGPEWANRSYVRVVPVRNLGDDEIQLAPGQPSCKCAQVTTFEPVVIPPQGTAGVRVELNLLTQGSSTEPPVSVGSRKEWTFEAEFAPIVSRRAGHSEWRVVEDSPRFTMAGRVRSFYSFTETPVNLAEVLVEGESFPLHSVLATCEQAVAQFRAECDARVASVEVQPLSAQRDLFELQIRPAPTLPVGPFAFEVQVTSLLAGDAPGPKIVLPVRGEVRPALALQPAKLVFGASRVGEACRADVSLADPLHGGWTIQDIRCDADPARLRFESSRKTDPTTFHVEVASLSRGEQVAKVVVAVRSPQGEINHLEAALKIHGI